MQDKCDKLEQSLAKHKARIEELTQEKGKVIELENSNRHLEAQIELLKSDSRKKGSLDRKDDQLAFEYQILKDKFEQISSLFTDNERLLQSKNEEIAILESKIKELESSSTQYDISNSSNSSILESQGQLQELKDQNANLHKAIKKAKEVS